MYSAAGLPERTREAIYDVKGRLESFRTGNGDIVDLSYDGFERLSGKTTKIGESTANTLDTEYTYLTEGNKTSILLSGISYEKNGNTLYSQEVEYDANGNIVKEIDQNGTREYTYDELNQLVQEIRYTNSTGYPRTTTSYSYDKAGNISQITKTPAEYGSDPTPINPPPGDITSGGSADGINGFPGEIEIPIDPSGPISASKFFFYQYRDPSWGDVLTRYNGSSFTYDTNGNPLSYKGNTLSWQDGKNLAAVAFAGGGTASYVYDCNGIRTSKTVDGIQHKYYTKEGVLLAESFSGKVLEFIYDEQSLPIGLVLNEGNTSTKYYFAKSIQGDVMALIAENRTIVARYDYDAYGKLLSVKDTSGTEITDSAHIANLNPIRYRGYYFDSETGFYYLNSRYYDPEICRFISADDASLLGANGTIPSYNLYAYCENNPVNCLDVDGNLSDLVAAMIGGAFAGAFFSAVNYVLSCAESGEKFSVGGLLYTTTCGAVNGAVGAAIGMITTRCAIATGIIKFAASAAWGGLSIPFNGVEKEKEEFFWTSTFSTFVGAMLPINEIATTTYQVLDYNIIGTGVVSLLTDAIVTDRRLHKKNGSTSSREGYRPAPGVLGMFAVHGKTIDLAMI